MQHTNGYSEAWTRAYAAGNLTRGIIMLFGTATLVYFFLSQYGSFSPGLFATTSCLLLFVASDAFRQLRRFYDAAFRNDQRGELEFDGVQLFYKPPGQTEIPIPQKLCRAYYPCREAIALDDGTLVKLRPVHPTARYLDSRHAYFTRILVEAWWPIMNLDIAEEVALSAFQKQRFTIGLITYIALATLIGVDFFIIISRLMGFAESDKSWILVPLSMSIGIFWLLYLWNQSIRDRAAIQLTSSDEDETSAA